MHASLAGSDLYDAFSAYELCFMWIDLSEALRFTLSQNMSLGLPNLLYETACTADVATIRRRAVQGCKYPSKQLPSMLGIHCMKNIRHAILKYLKASTV